VEVERAIGRLEGEIKGIRQDMTEIKKDLKSVLAWKWKIVGGALTVAAVVSGIVELSKFVLIK
jgi:hypothetical protein